MERSEGIEQSPQRPQVLLVDDSPTIRLCVEQQLAQIGCEAVCVNTIEQAYLALEQSVPSLILMDYSMTPIAGDEGCALIKSDPRFAHLPVVLISGESMSSERVVRCSQAGVDDFVAKPISLYQLRRKVEAVTQFTASPGRRTGPVGAVKSVLLIQGPGPYHSMLARLLELSGYRVDIRDSMPAPGEKVEAVDLVLVDLETTGLPWKTVFEATERFSRRGASAILSTQARPEEAARPPFDVAWFCKVEMSMERMLAQINTALRRTAPGLLRLNGRLPFYSIVDFREKVPGRITEWVTGYSHDISPGGIFVKTLSPLMPGTELELRVRVPAKSEVMLFQGLVAWANCYSYRVSKQYPAGMGIQFSDLHDAHAAYVRNTWEGLARFSKT